MTYTGNMKILLLWGITETSHLTVYSASCSHMVKVTAKQQIMLT